MLSLTKKKLPPLLKAMVEDNLEKFLYLCQQKEQRLALDPFGFAIDEIALYLEKKNYLQFIRPYTPKTFNLLLPGETEVKKIDQAEWENLLQIHYLSKLKFADYTQFIKVIKNCPWLLKWHFFRKEMEETMDHYYQKIVTSFVPDLTIRWIDEKLQYGAFTNVDLKAGDYLGEYTGIVRSFNPLRENWNPYCMQYPRFFWSFHFLMIDASLEGNETRFYNHSFHPNATPKIAYDRGLLHVIFAALKPISKGEQITFNYGKHYWRKKEKPQEI